MREPRQKGTKPHPLHPPVNVKTSGSLPDLKEIGCKSVWAVHISPLF
jgi:hypothetical protein